MNRLFLAAIFFVAALAARAQFIQVYSTAYHGNGASGGSSGGGGGGGGVANPIDPSHAPTLTSSAPSWVWTVSDPYTKVIQNTAGIPSSSQTFKLSGARNGLVVGQFFLQVPAGGLQSLNVGMTNLTNTVTGAVISTQSATSAGAFRLYISSYVVTSTPTANSSLGYLGYTGPVPDPLIPNRDPYFNQKTNVLPMNVAAGNNQGFAIEGLIPTGIASGFYTFNVFITTGSYQVASLAGALEVFESTLPATATFPMQNGVGYGDICTQAWGSNSACNTTTHESCSNSDDCAMVFMHDEAVFALDHRQSISFNPGGWSTSQIQNRMGMLLNGTTSSILINPLLAGAALTTYTPNGVTGFTSNATAASWMTSFQTAQPSQWTKVKPANYACDEPPTIPWSTCFTSMGDIAASGMPNLITTTYSAALTQGATGQINIFVPLVNNLPGHASDYSNWLVTQSSATLGSYADCVSSADGNGTGSCNGQHGGSAVGACAVAGSCGWPNPHIDGRPINNMALWPVMAISSATLQLNSTATECWTTACGSTVLATDSLWTTGGILFDGQGDETWWWSGTPGILGVSVPFVVGTLRYDLTAYGEQYREYENILNNNGQGNYAAAQRYTWISSEGAINENPYAPATYNSVAYSGNVVAAQQNLLCKIQSLTYSGASCAW